MIRPGSQNARLLEVLRRGPATNAEIHAEAGHMIVNSRVAELRARGYLIECEHVDGEVGATAYRYTLVSEPPLERVSTPCEEGAVQAARAPVVPDIGDVEACSSGEQLSLEVAA